MSDNQVNSTSGYIYSPEFLGEVLEVFVTIPTMLGARNTYAVGFKGQEKEHDPAISLSFKPADDDFVTPSAIANFIDAVVDIGKENIGVDYESNTLFFKTVDEFMDVFGEYLWANPQQIREDDLNVISEKIDDIYSSFPPVDKTFIYHAQKWPKCAYGFSRAMSAIVGEYEGSKDISVGYYEENDGGTIIGLHVMCTPFSEDGIYSPADLSILEDIKDDCIVYGETSDVVVKYHENGKSFMVEADSVEKMLGFIEACYDGLGMASSEERHVTFNIGEAAEVKYGEDKGRELLTAPVSTAHSACKSFARDFLRYLQGAHVAEVERLKRQHGADVLAYTPMVAFSSVASAHMGTLSGLVQKTISLEELRARVSSETGKALPHKQTGSHSPHTGSFSFH